MQFLFSLFIIPIPPFIKRKTRRKRRNDGANHSSFKTVNTIKADRLRKNAYQCNHEKVQRIIYVKHPFHNFVYSRILAALTVVEGENGNGEQNSKLYKPVGHGHGKAIDKHVKTHEKQTPKDLRERFAAICAYCKHAKGRDATPIGRKCGYAQQKDKKWFDRLLDIFAVIHAEHNKSDCKRPHDARLIENMPHNAAARSKRNERKRAELEKRR